MNDTKKSENITNGIFAVIAVLALVGSGLWAAVSVHSAVTETMADRAAEEAKYATTTPQGTTFMPAYDRVFDGGEIKLIDDYGNIYEGKLMSHGPTAARHAEIKMDLKPYTNVLYTEGYGNLDSRWNDEAKAWEHSADAGVTWFFDIPEEAKNYPGMLKDYNNYSEIDPRTLK